MKQGFQRAVPAAHERFNDALDELENDVLLAQTVLRSHVAKLHQDRRRRDAAAKQHEVERARAAAHLTPALSLKDPNVVAVKPDATTPPVPPEPSPPLGHLSAPALPHPPRALALEPTQPPPAHTTAASSAPSAPSADSLVDATPANSTTEEHEFDFDFEFGDAMAAGPHNDPDAMDTSADLDFALDEAPSLLRGLEDFANAKGADNDNMHPPTTNTDLDFPMSHLSDMTSDAKPPLEPLKPAEPAPHSLQPLPPADDAHDSKPTQNAPDTDAAVDPNDANDTNDTTNSNDEPMETMTTNNLDDLFNLDDYENPEGADSAFDDAFFNFD